MNLAYTYGWHPISMAIPALLASFWMLRQRRIAWAMVLAGLAMSMEEGVIVVVSLFSAACAFWLWWDRRHFGQTSQDMAEQTSGLNFRVWAIWSVATALLFVIVYMYSGLREFQTGRFVALGDTPTEIILSPVMRPRLSGDNCWIGGILCLWPACGFPATFWRCGTVAAGCWLRHPRCCCWRCGIIDRRPVSHSITQVLCCRYFG